MPIIISGLKAGEIGILVGTLLFAPAKFNFILNKKTQRLERSQTRKSHLIEALATETCSRRSFRPGNESVQLLHLQTVPGLLRRREMNGMEGLLLRLGRRTVGGRVSHRIPRSRR